MSFITDKLTLTAFKSQFQSYKEVIFEYDNNVKYVERKVFVADLSDNKIYQNKVYNNSNNPLADSTKWEEVIDPLIIDAKLDLILTDSLIMDAISSLDESNLDNRVYIMNDENPLKTKIYNLFIAHYLYKNKLQSLGKNLSMHNASGVIMTSASDGENSGSGEILPQYKSQLFTIYKDTVFGIEYFNEIYKLSTFVNMVIGDPIVNEY